jgi:hypothetical protein
MKFTRIFVIAVAVFAFFSTVAQGQQTTTAPSVAASAALPTSLSGRWHTEDNRYSQIWEVNKIDQSALVMWWSSRKNCNLSDVPAKIEYDGSTLKIFVVETKRLPCFSSFVAELTKNGDGFEGKVSQASGSVNTNYPYTLTTLK